MDEDKISSDVNDKRKVEDDTSYPKPNPKRIKLVRPVFSSVVKPMIFTTNECSKSDIQLTEVSKSVTLSDKISNEVNIPQSSNNLIQDSEIIIKSNDLQKCVKQTVESLETLQSTDELTERVKSYIEPFETVKSQVNPIEIVKSVVEPTETIKSPVEPLETVKTTIELLESVNKHIEPLLVTSIVNEEQADSSSDALEIPNIFSEETKKELENLKKNIFKVEDDGSSSENDSQPKRPRLKRPTFVISTNENKVESNNPTVLDKINEISKLNLVNLEEEINTIDSITEKNINNLTEKIDESLIANEEEHNSIIIGNIIEKETVLNENIGQVLEEKYIKIENINRVFKEKPIESLTAETTEFINIKKPNEKENGEILVIEKKAEGNTLELENECEITQKVVDIELKNIKTNVNIQEEHIEKEQLNILVEKKPTDLGKVNLNVEESITTQVVIDKKEIFEKDLNEKITHSNIIKNVRVVLEKYGETKSEDNDNNITIEIKNNTIFEENTTNDIFINDKDVKDEIIDTIEDIPVNTAFKTIKNEKDTNLEIEESCINTQFLNENNPSIDVSSKQNNEEYESQIHKSDILKAALMAKKSLESLVNTSNNQFATDSHPTSLVIKKSDILPKIGEEAIVNKIEAEIKLSTQDQPTSNKKSHNKIINNVTETNNFKEISSSHCFIENNTVNKNDEPPKWGSAKMNEVEKFLNDSNVTITPINKPQETPKLGKITLKLPKVGNPEIKTETTVRPDVKSELIKKITNKQIVIGDNQIKSALSQPSNSFSDFATIRPAPKPSAEQIALLEQQILNTPKKRGRPSKALAQQKQLLLQYQQQQLHIVQEGSIEGGSEPVFHAPLFDMEDMSEGTGIFNLFDASTPKRGKGIRGKGSRGRRGRGGGSIRGRDESDSDTASKISRIDDEGETYHQEMNEDEETKQAALIEAERLRKEEAREKKLEERKKRIKERYDLLKEKKLKKKLKAEERRLQWHENKRLMQEEKARAAEMKKSLPPPQNFDDETRMSADCNNSRSQTPARHFMMGDDDLSISGTTNDSIRLKKGRMEVIDFESNKTLTVDQIAEYQWPLEGGELYMIQEQISNFLGVKSFKRKYPSLKRRNVEAEERTFLCDSGLVAESLCDLGLTVLYSSEVLDVMYADFPEKYEELREYMRLKHAKELSNRQRALTTISSNTDGSKLDLRDRAMEAAANWNVNFNKSRLESRKCSMDMQTFIVHYPKNKCKKMTIPKPKIGNYPLALLPGQFCDYYATYSTEDLRYLPLNTVMYGPIKSVDKDFPVSLSSQSESEDSSSDDSSDSDDSVEVDDKLEKNGLECGPSDKKGAECKLCSGTAEKNKNEIAEPLIHCSKCLTIYHPTCLDMTLEMVPHIKRYNWQCNECKSCAQCKELADEDKILFCDLCDRGYHIYCVGLRKVPEGRWHCQECAMCSSCGVSDPGPGDSKWFYEFKKIEKTGSKVYCRTLCAPCSRSWKKGHYCPNCMRCYTIKTIERMIQCNSCDRYLHPECISENDPNRQVVACTICEEKAVSRLLTTVPRALIKV